MPRLLLGFAATLFYCATALAQQTGVQPTAAQTGGVEISDAWARATPGGAENGAAYLTLVSPAGDRLTGITSPAAAKAQLHEMTNNHGIMQMREVPAIDLPPGKKMTLKPGGLHIMLMGLKHPLQPGQSVPLSLRFEKSGTREVNAAIGKVGAMGPETQSGTMQTMPMPMPSR
jgi:copper(I)-binding protein